MSDRTQERRPEIEAASEVQVATCGKSTPIAMSTRDVELLADRVDHALVVVTGLANGGTRARTVLTIAAAQRILANAERRGCPASVALVKLTPVNVTPAALADMLATTEAGGPRG